MQPESLTPHPLRQWRVRNFKSLVDETVDLAPLTVLVGANSSGKSSLIQSILLVTQSARGLRPDDAIALNGPLVRLGRLDDLQSVQAEEAGVQLGGTLDIGSFGGPGASNSAPVSPWTFAASTLQAVSWVTGLKDTPEGRPGAACVAFSEMQASTEATEAKLIVRRMQQDVDSDARLADSSAVLGRAVSGFTWFKGEVVCPDVAATPIEGATLHGGVVTQPLVAESETRVFAAAWWRRHQVGRRTMQAEDEVEALRGRIASLERRLSSPLVAETRQRIERQLEELRADVERVQHVEQFADMSSDQKLEVLVREAIKALTDFGEEGGGVAALFRSTRTTSYVAATLIANADIRPRIEEFLERVEAAHGPGRAVLIPADTEWAGLLTEAGRQVRAFISERVRYLGPLRQDPHEGGFVSGVPGEVGTRGESTAATLFAESRRVLDFPLPAGGPRRCTLAEAFEAWVQYLGLARAVRAEDLTRSGVEMRVRPPGLDREVDLTAVGVGVSQVLPVLLECLLAEPPSIILLEQPELHLHPAVQQRLADFFIACAESGRQVVIETHSEYLISRLRLRVAEDLTDATRSLSKLLFAEMDGEGRTQFRPVGITELGGLDEWPDGFFDQGPGEAQQILMAALRKRQEMHAQDPNSVEGDTGSESRAGE